MDYHQLVPRYEPEGGVVMAYGHYAVQPDPIDAGYARQVDDYVMDETFDFQGYYDEPRTDAAAYSQQKPTVPSQASDDSQHDQDMDIESSEETNNGDSWRDLVDAAHANYYSEDPMKDVLLLPKLTVFNEDFREPPGSFNVAEIDKLTSVERWDVSKSTMEFLANVLALSAPADDLTKCCGLEPLLRGVKLEEPVLLSDTATDMHRLRERNIVKLTSNGIKPFPSDKRHDQGLRWSKSSLKLPDEVDELIAAEKMIVNSETGNMLKDVFEDMNEDPLSSFAKDFQHRVSLQHIWYFCAFPLTRLGSISTDVTPAPSDVPAIQSWEHPVGCGTAAVHINTR